MNSDSFENNVSNKLLVYKLLKRYQIINMNRCHISQIQDGPVVCLETKIY